MNHKTLNILLLSLVCGASSQAAITSFTDRAAFNGATTGNTQYNLPGQQGLSTTPIRFRPLNPGEQASEIWTQDIFDHIPGTAWPASSNSSSGAFGGGATNYINAAASQIPNTAPGFSDFTGNEFRGDDIMHFVVDVKTGTASALGWYSVQPTGPGTNLSKFEVRAFNGATLVDTFEFTPATYSSGPPVGNVFFGVTTTSPFTSLRFRELNADGSIVTPDSPPYQVGDPEPEFFGNFVFATAATAVPEASTSLSLLVGSMLLMARRKRA